MSRRLEIEITSLNGDSATWRAAGAKLPKGTLSTSLLPAGAAVGTIFRADVEQDMIGIEVLAVLPAKTASPLDPKNERLTIETKFKGDGEVTVTYAPKGKGRPRRDGDGPRDAAKPRGERRPRRDAGNDGEKRERRPRRDGDRPARAPYAGIPQITTHRNAMFATLSPQELPIAEKLVLGGIKAVRDAVAEQNKNAVAQQRTPVDVATIDRIATDLLPRVALAAWKDKAAGAVSAGRELRLRDLRAVVTAAKTVTLDDEGRAQLKELRDQLTARLEQLTNSWTEKITAAIASNNVKEALGLLSSPPDITIKVSSEMAATVTALASQALSAEQSPAEWRAIVEVASQTSIRRNIKPTGIPADDESKACALHYAGAIPEIAKLLGMKVPPPPPPARSGTSRPSRGPRRS